MNTSQAPAIVWSSLPMSELAKGERRFEGEAYLTGGFAIRRAIEASGCDRAPIGQLAKVWMPGRLKGIRVAQQHGIPFFTATQAFDIRPRPRKWLAPKHTKDLESRYVKPGWILVTCSGSVGDTIISYAPHAGTILSHDILRVQSNDSSQTGYLYSFFRTKYGRTMLRSSQYGSIIKHLEPEHLEPIPVPLVNKSLRRLAQNNILSVFQKRDEAFALAREAEELYQKAIGVKPSPTSREDGFTVSSNALFSDRRRFDGYFYNPRAACVLAAIRASGKKTVPLRSVCQEVFLPNRFARVKARGGTAYLDSEDIFKINPEITKFIGKIAKGSEERYLVRKGWILLARSGQIYGLNGSTMLADTWHEQKIISEHIIRIIPDTAKIRPGYLQMAMGHPVFGRPLVIRMSFGTEVPEISPEDVEAFPVVRLSGDTEDRIADAVERATELRSQADIIEDATATDVELAIDKMLGTSAAEIAEPPNPSPPKVRRAKSG